MNYTETIRSAGTPIVEDMLTEEISQLTIDHPGAHDADYRARRNFIARLARDYRENCRQGSPAVIPFINYTEEETEVWRSVYERLDAAHQQRASAFYLSAKRRLGITGAEIPQLIDMDRKLRRLTGFRLAPVEGLVEARAFLRWLEKKTMLCTQYVRHHSRPDYTPEPDIIHEAIGHIPNFTNEDFAAFSQFIGRGARIASDQQLEQLSRLYWFTVEFGLIEEAGEIRAFGAGLLSSSGELEHAFSDNVERRPFSIAEVIVTPYDYSDIQPVLFVIPSYAELKEATREFIEGFGR
jgi:monomeric phenylalanine-4-hydroxylase